jgi:hypothetical protein
MYTFDASSMIHAWDNYPIEQFPGLWEWYADQASKGVFTISEIAFDEVSHKSPDCGTWLNDIGIIKVPLSKLVIEWAQYIKHLLGVVEDNFHPKGVGENDLFIVATAKSTEFKLVSEEGRQPNRLNVLSKSKIPAVCRLPEVNVPCIKFIELIKASDTTF